MYYAEIWLSTVGKAASDSKQSRESQALDEDDPITKMLGKRKAASAAVVVQAEGKKATDKDPATDTTGKTSDGAAVTASADSQAPHPPSPIT